MREEDCTTPSATDGEQATVDDKAPVQPTQETARPRELGGPKGLEPTRYGDWERNGRCIDF
ncbi:MAG: DUF1674 domain-containing protein [Gammaproteobacteria bacterium]|nr:DUF1674 domain-containing protein [Gammaproteobacteria bacterium]